MIKKITFERYAKLLYLKLFRINDSPQRVALGLGLGVFTGILPGIGPIAALVLAIIFRANRASAVIGSILTNTWISVLGFILSLKIGAAIMHLDWRAVKMSYVKLLTQFSWSKVFEETTFYILLPVAIGYLIFSLLVGISFYLIFLIILTLNKKRKQLRNHLRNNP